MKKIIAIMMLVGMVAFTAPTPAKGQTVADLQAMIMQLQAQLAALMGGTGSTGSLVSCTFTRALAPGASGADVQCLQRFLNSAGHMVATTGAGSPGMESMTYGPRTQAAVAAWQAARGVVCGAYCGYFGPASQAAYTAHLAAGGGTPGTPGTPVAGLTGTASIQSITDMSQYATEDVGEGQNDVKVLGREIEMDNTGNARIQQVRVKFDHAGGTEVADSSNNFTRYAEEVSVMLNGTEVGSAMASDFSRDSSGIYSRTILLNSSAILNSGANNELVVAVSAVSNLDSGDEGEQWDVNIENIRYVDGTGAIITDSSTGDLESTETLTFVALATSTDLELKFVPASNNPVAKTVEVSTTTDTQDLTLLSFTMKAQGARIWVDEIPVILTTSDNLVSDVVSKIMLEIGSSTFTETLPTSGTGTDCDGAAFCTVTFDDLDFWIEADTTVTAMVVMDAQELDAYSEATTIKADITSTQRDEVVSEDENGDNIVDGSKTGVVTGENQTLRSSGVSITNFSSSVATRTTGANSDGVEGDYTISFTVSAFGDTVYIPRVISRTSGATAGLLYIVENSAGSTVSASAITSSHGLLSSSNATLNSSDLWEVPDGSSRTFTTVITLSAPTTDGFHHIQLTSLQHDTVSDDTTPDSSETFAPANQYETKAANVKNPS